MIYQASSTAPVAFRVGLAATAAFSAMGAAMARALGGSVRPFVVGVVRTAFGALAIPSWIAARAGALGSACSLSRPQPLLWADPTLRDGGSPVMRGLPTAACIGLAACAFCLADASVVAPVDVLRLLTVVSGIPFGGIVGLAAWLGGAVICGSALLAPRGQRAVVPEADTKH